MGKNLTIKGGENCFWLCQNTLYNVLVLLIKCFSHVMGSMNQCLNVLVKGVVGSCRNVPLFLWRVRIQPCQMKVCFLFTQPRISQAFSLLQVSSTQRCLAHQCQTRAFPVSDSSRYSLTHLTAAVFHQSQCDLRKKKNKTSHCSFPQGCNPVLSSVWCSTPLVWGLTKQKKLQIKNYKMTRFMCAVPCPVRSVTESRCCS